MGVSSGYTLHLKGYRDRREPSVIRITRGKTVSLYSVQRTLAPSLAPCQKIRILIPELTVIVVMGSVFPVVGVN
jgi:hypothetical protein